MTRASERGFTMIEVMIAILLSAVAVIGIIGLYTIESRAAGVSRRKTEAAELAQDKVEELRTMVSPTADGSGSEVYLDEHGNGSNSSSNGHIYTRSWTIVGQGSPVDVYTITVTVTWESNTIVVKAQRSAT